MIAILFLLSFLMLAYVAFCISSDEGEIGRRLFFSVSFALIVIILISTILVICGLYNVLSVVAMVTTLGIFGLVYLNVNKKIIRPGELIKKFIFHKWNYFVAAILVICAVLYLFFPTTYLLGGRDQGLYLINGINIARTGTMQIREDTFLTEHYEALKNVISLGYSGIYSDLLYGISDIPGELTPQFLPVFPALLAIGFDLFGLPGLIRVNCIIALFAILSVYFFSKEVFGKKTAALAMVFMAVNPSQIWNARITQTELLCQFFFFLSVLFCVFALKSNSNKKAVIAGLLIGFGSLCRIDTFIWGPAVYLFLIYSSLFNRRHLSVSIRITIPMTFLFALSLLYGFNFSYPYYNDLWSTGSLKSIVFLNFILLAVSGFAYILSFKLRNKHAIDNYFLKVIDNYHGRLIIAIVLLLVFLFAYFVRPSLSAEYNFKQNAMVEFCWYTSFIALPLCIYGIFLILSKQNSYRETLFVFLLIGISSMFVYIYRPSISPDHLFASRRWITVNIPFVLVVTAYGAVSLFKLANQFSKRYMYVLKTISIAASLFISFYMIYHNLPFLFVKMLDKIDSNYEVMMEDLNKDALFFADTGHVSGILKYVYGLNAYTISDKNVKKLGEVIDSLDTGETYLLSSVNNIPIQLESEYKYIDTFNIGGTFLEESTGTYPKELYNRKHDLSLYKITSRDADKPMTLRLSDDMYLDFEYKENERFVSSAGGGWFLWGPYMDLKKGKYICEFELILEKFKNNDIGEISITADNGENIKTKGIHADDFENDTLTVSVPFECLLDCSNVEFRIFLNEGSVLSLKEQSVTLCKTYANGG